MVGIPEGTHSDTFPLAQSLPHSLSNPRASHAAAFEALCIEAQAHWVYV